MPLLKTFDVALPAEPEIGLPPGGRGLDQRGFGALAGEIALWKALDLPRAPPRDEGFGVNWSYLRHEVQEKARGVLSSCQVIELGARMTEWVQYTEELAQAAERAEAEVARAISETSELRQERLALGGRVIWLVLTTAAPPPFGALAGAVARAVLGEKTWVGCFRVATEWTLQAPFPHTNGKADFLGVWRPGAPGRDTKSAALRYIGGHPSLRELKDAHQLLQSFDKCWSGAPKTLFDRIDESTVASLLALKKPSKASGPAMRQRLKDECREKLGALRQGIVATFDEFAQTHLGAERVVSASYKLQADALGREIARQRLSAAGARALIQEEVLRGARLFLNTLAHALLRGQLGSAGASGAPGLDGRAAQQEFERMFLAAYLMQRESFEPATMRPVARDAEDRWVHGVGTVKAHVFQGALEAKLKELGVTEQFAGASLIGTGRTATYDNRVQHWRPPPIDAPDWQSVPYQRGGPSARGRLAAWARFYTARSPDQVYAAFARANLPR